MRILIVGPSNRFQSGISTYTLRLANALDEAGHDVSVIAFRKLLPRFLFPGAKRVGKKELSALAFRPRVRVFDEMDYDSPLSWRKARRFLEREKPDRVILQWWTSSAAHMHLRIKRAAEKLGIPVYVEMHEVVDPLEQKLFPIAAYARVMGPRVLRGNAGYITHSESDRKLVSQAYGLDDKQVTVVPHGSYDHFGPAVTRDDARTMLGIREPFVLLSFGLVRAYKGIPTLVAAFEALPPELRAKARLLIVGEVWEDKAETLRLVRESPVASQITLVDRYVADDEVPRSSARPTRSCSRTRARAKAASRTSRSRTASPSSPRASAGSPSPSRTTRARRSSSPAACRTSWKPSPSCYRRGLRAQG